METLYKDVPGFRKITIVQYRHGSVVCTYAVNLDVTSHRDKTWDITLSKVQEVQKQLDYWASVNNIGALTTGYLRRNRPTENAQAQVSSRSPCMATGICPVGYVCHYTNGVTSCVHKCKDDNPCKHEAECYVDEQNNVGCRCKTSDTSVYYGDHCEHSNERLQMQSKYIILLACAGGAVLLVALICVCCLCIKRKPMEKGEYSFQ
ncbi:hypothetical protein KP79_PYT24201 [Mizuhopecten yessoensis]|uniref:EGF-like domain-containing protein n=1 Tax=Mizuhopecten yessoensis TaxID=6573 RepID=A0A210Q4R1_MIZYE|nr:hypothetical protein KP79_PYT24201 [Mizuhopecten yessoensis]